MTSKETGTPETAPKIGLFWNIIIKILIIANDVISIGILSIENKITLMNIKPKINHIYKSIENILFLAQ